MSETNVDVIDQLIQGIQFKEPRLYDALRAINGKLRELDKTSESLRSALAGEGTGQAIVNVQVFTYEFTSRNVILRWVFPSGVRQVEIRQGNTWETGNIILISPSTSAIIEPLPIGLTRFWLKGIDSSGNYSADATGLEVTVPSIQQITVSADVIDNNVLLRWTEPQSTFEISYYDVDKGGVSLGYVDANFKTIFEAAGGTYEYGVTAYDIAGNASARYSISAVVRQPPDYSLQDTLTDTLLDGTKVNTVVENGRLLCNITSETWQQHFVNNGWISPQEQVNAGYERYITPTPLVGTYTKTFDAGTIYNNVIINLLYEINQLFGTTAVVAEISVSDDNITYTPYVAGRTLYVASVRYLRVRFTFTATTDEALLEFSNFYATMDVKREVDSGNVNALAADVGGTLVNFNKSFKDVDSITLVADSDEPIYPVYDFVDAPNPTSFRILVFDSAGQRINKLVSWKARGIV